MEHCTYCTVHAPSGKFYIGKGLVRRVMLNGYRGSGVRFARTLKKYGPEGWHTLVLRTFNTAADALAHEEELVGPEALKNPLCLNLILGGRGSPMRDTAVRAKVSAKLKGRVFTEEWKQKISAAGSGKTLSLKHRAAISASSGGWQHSQEAKDKIAASKIGKPCSEETKRKISETKQRQRAAKKIASAQ